MNLSSTCNETVTDEEVKEAIDELLEEMGENGFIYFQNKSWNDLSPEEQQEARQELKEALEKAKEELED